MEVTLARRETIWQPTLKSEQYITLWFSFQQPIFLNIRLRSGQGKESGMDSPFVSVDAEVFAKQPLRKVISINGEIVDASDLDNMDIHDYSTFEQEDLLTGKFISKIRRKTYPQSGVKKELRKQLSWHEIVLNVVRAEHVLMAFRNYKRRCDSETEDSDIEQEQEPDDSGDQVHRSSSSPSFAHSEPNTLSDGEDVRAVVIQMEKPSSGAESDAVPVTRSTPQEGRESSVSSVRGAGAVNSVDGRESTSGCCSCVVLWYLVPHLLHAPLFCKCSTFWNSLCADCCESTKHQCLAQQQPTIWENIRERCWMLSRSLERKQNRQNRFVHAVAKVDLKV